MENPISKQVRGWLFVVGAVIGVFAAVLGPLTTALNLSEEWTAVAVSFVGAVTAALNLLARANLSDDTQVVAVDLDATDSHTELEPEEWGYDDEPALSEESVRTGRHAALEGDEDASTE